MSKSKKEKISIHNLFLTKLLRELLKNTETYQKFFIELGVKKLIDEEEKRAAEKKISSTTAIKDVKDFVRKKIQRDLETVSEQTLEESVFKDFFREFENKKIRERLRIPESKLPETFRYLKPKPSLEEIDLKKINPLIKDQLIKIIECKGPNEEIIVEGKFGRKKTKITLSKPEIDEIIRAFSIATRIPTISKGVYKVVYGKLILSAVISEEYGSKFIITKMLTPQQPTETFLPKPPVPSDLPDQLKTKI